MDSQLFAKTTTTNKMVSTWTGRLPTDGSSNWSKKRKCESVDVANTCGGSSGYSADDDQKAGPSVPPWYVDFQAKREGEKTRLGSGSVNENNQSVPCTKRLKALEKENLAHTAAETIARGGLSMPVLRLDCPRMLEPFFPINMSRVTLVKSSDSPLMDPKPLNLSKFSKERTRELSIQTILALTHACRHFYELPREAKSTDVERCDDQSSTSSVTDTDDEEAKPKEQGVISMCDALSFCKSPRIVVLSTAPYIVVHVNAAYLQMSGLSSVRLLGQPLEYLIHDEKWIANLKAMAGTDKPFSLDSLNQKVIKARGGSPKHPILNCKVTSSPIGMTPDHITHFALGLTIDESDARDSQVEETTAPAMTVTG